MDEKLTQRMLAVVHGPQWNTFQEWVDEEERLIAKEMRRGTDTELLVIRGKLLMIDRLRELKDKVHVELQIQEDQQLMAAEEQE
tara:strand:- start:527 stop:778 length:252 start_codon:yes stop_codon:yes gene_type:complete